VEPDEGVEVAVERLSRAEPHDAALALEGARARRRTVLRNWLPRAAIQASKVPSSTTVALSSRLVRAVSGRIGPGQAAASSRAHGCWTDSGASTSAAGAGRAAASAAATAAATAAKRSRTASSATLDEKSSAITR